jgi:hypothetical protein
MEGDAVADSDGDGERDADDESLPPPFRPSHVGVITGDGDTSADLVELLLIVYVWVLVGERLNELLSVLLVVWEGLEDTELEHVAVRDGSAELLTVPQADTVAEADAVMPGDIVMLTLSEKLGVADEVCEPEPESEEVDVDEAEKKGL